MNYRVVSQRKIEDTSRGPRFEILITTEEHENIHSTYVFYGGSSSIVSHDDANLELLAKMTQEEIMREVYSFLKTEGYDKSQPIG